MNSWQRKKHRDKRQRIQASGLSGVKNPPPPHTQTHTHTQSDGMNWNGQGLTADSNEIHYVGVKEVKQ